jgi:hypothetical protein
MSEIALGYSVPKDQRMRYTITPLEGQLMNAESIGGQLVALSKLYKACAKEEDPKTKWMLAILNIETDASGKISFDLLLAPKMPGRGNGVERPASATEARRVETEGLDAKHEGAVREAQTP